MISKDTKGNEEIPTRRKLHLVPGICPVSLVPRFDTRAVQPICAIVTTAPGSRSHGDGVLLRLILRIGDLSNTGIDLYRGVFTYSCALLPVLNDTVLTTTTRSIHYARRRGFLLRHFLRPRACKPPSPTTKGTLHREVIEKSCGVFVDGNRLPSLVGSQVNTTSCSCTESSYTHRQLLKVGIRHKSRCKVGARSEIPGSRTTTIRLRRK